MHTSKVAGHHGVWLPACDCPQVLGDHELEPMSKSLLAAPHSMCELRALLCKTVISVADILFKPLPHLQTVLYVLACGLIFYYHARMVSAAVPARYTKDVPARAACRYAAASRANQPKAPC